MVGGGSGGTNDRPETDHVTSGPMRGLEKYPDSANRHPDGQNGDSMTESAKWGQFRENLPCSKIQIQVNVYKTVLIAFLKRYLQSNNVK